MLIGVSGGGSGKQPPPPIVAVLIVMTFSAIVGAFVWPGWAQGNSNPVMVSNIEPLGDTDCTRVSGDCATAVGLCKPRNPPRDKRARNERCVFMPSPVA